MTVFVVGFAACGLAFSTDASGAPSRVTIIAGDADRENTPVTIALPDRYAGRTDLGLRDATGDNQLPLQPLPEAPNTFCFILPELAAGMTVRYRLAADEQSQRDKIVDRVSVTADEKAIDVRIGQRRVLHYNIATVEAPEGLAPYYRRSGYVHPVYDPQGRVVTGDFNPDHAHQHGLFFAWVNTEFDDMAVDFWNQAAQTGGVAHEEVLETVSGPVFGQFRVKLRHFVGPGEESEQNALEETWTLRIYDVRAEDTEAPFLFDLVSQQRCATEKPLQINEYHYGGMGIRGSDQWTDKDKSEFLTSDGNDRRGGNHTRPKWVDLSGPIDGTDSGIAVIGHPDNFGHPQPVRLHPSMPYFCFAPCVLGEFKIAPGDTYTSQYRYVVHAGSADSRLLDQLSADYTAPPEVTVEEE